MRHSKIFFCTLTLFLFLSACGGPDLAMLEGKWRAVAWTDTDLAEQEPIDSDMQIEFLPNKRYIAHLSGGIPEAGRYSSMRNNLFVTDTTVENPTERSVQITRLVQDTLYLRFGKSGAQAVLVLTKQ